MLRGSVFRSAYELFYTAVAPAEKRAVKSLIDVGVERLGDAVGAGAVSLLLVLAPGRYSVILFAACACSTIAFLLALVSTGDTCRRSRRAWSIAPSSSIRDGGRLHHAFGPDAFRVEHPRFRRICAGARRRPLRPAPHGRPIYPAGIGSSLRRPQRVIARPQQVRPGGLDSRSAGDRAAGVGRGDAGGTRAPGTHGPRNHRHAGGRSARLRTATSRSGAACLGCWLRCRPRARSRDCSRPCRISASRCASMPAARCICCSRITPN